MRVIGGTARGMKLECPPGDAVRPTPDMAREALFNILRDEVEGARVLDLFAGAGTFGIEALSRGAAHAIFVEISPKHRQFITRNLKHTRLEERGEVLAADAFRAPELLKRRNELFDIIYIGPPFPLWQDPQRRAAIVSLLDRLAEQKVLAEEAVIIIQHDTRDPMPENTPHLRVSERRTYGRNVFSFYVTPASASSEPSQ